MPNFTDSMVDRLYGPKFVVQIKKGNDWVADETDRKTRSEASAHRRLALLKQRMPDAELRVVPAPRQPMQPSS